MKETIKRTCASLALVCLGSFAGIGAIASPDSTQRFDSPTLSLFDAQGRPYYPQDAHVFAGVPAKARMLTIARPESAASVRAPARATPHAAQPRVTRSPVIATERFVRPAVHPRAAPVFRSMAPQNSAIMDTWSVGVFR